MNNSIIIMTGAIIIPLLCIAFVMIIITHVYKLNERKNIYKRLHIMGMSKKSLNWLLELNYLTYLLVSYIFYCIILFLRYFTEPDFINNLGSYFFNQNIVCFLILIAVGAILSIYHSRWMKRNI